MNPSSAASPARRGCPRCGAPLGGLGFASTGGDIDTAPCGSCLLLAGLEDEEPPPPTTLPSDGNREVTAIAGTDAPGPDGLGLQLGDHILVRELGRGSMGVIYEALQPGTRRPVALKTISRALGEDADVRARFAREAEAVASLDHPFILPVYEVGDEDGRPYFTMKLAEGGSLLKALPRFAGRPREAVALMAKVTRGVAHAHGRGILHRDLKPGNVLLDADGETPLVSDFGLARWLDRDSDLTQSLVIFGTPGYMAPEQARHAGRAGPAADVYSLGAMLFQLLCGRVPFRGGNAMEVIEQAAAGPAPRLRTFNPKAARDLETICARCLEIEPVSRPKCAADLADDLERWLAGRPIKMRPVRLPERVWRWSAQNPWLAGAVAGCVLLGVVAVKYQYQAKRINNRLLDRQSKQRSLLVLPILNLDDATNDLQTASVTASGLREESDPRESDTILSLSRLPQDWTGVSRPEELRSVAMASGCRMVLAGTRRTLADGQVRLVLRLIEPFSSRTLNHWTLEVRPGQSPVQALRASGLPKTWQQLFTDDEVPRGLPSTAEDSALDNEQSRELVTNGRRLMDTHTLVNLNQAISCFEDAIRLSPRSVHARCYLAMAYIGSDWVQANPDYVERALRCANEALALSPDDPTAHRALAVIHNSAGHYEVALEHALRSAEAGESGERAYGYIGFIKKILGHPDQAIRWFELAKRSENRVKGYEASLGDCYADTNEDQLAWEAYKRASRLHPELPDGWLGLCRLALLQGDVSTARALHAQHFPDYKGYISATLMGAQIEFFARDFGAAARWYQELGERRPGQAPDAYAALDPPSALARMTLEEDRPAAGPLVRQCVEAEQKLLQQSPGRPDVLYRLAAAEAMNGTLPDALEHLTAAIAAGWRDHRSLRLDPRFDALRGEPKFEQILEGLAARVADLRKRQPAALPDTAPPQKPTKSNANT